ncbi:hypothetical protein KM043_001604 [Ampulex compressa]|nr:hypothetical protein KM043_001604 [Ampulex compressa]
MRAHQMFRRRPRKFPRAPTALAKRYESWRGLPPLPGHGPREGRASRAESSPSILPPLAPATAPKRPLGQPPRIARAPSASQIERPTRRAIRTDARPRRALAQALKSRTNRRVSSNRFSAFLAAAPGALQERGNIDRLDSRAPTLTSIVEHRSTNTAKIERRQRTKVGRRGQDRESIEQRLRVGESRKWVSREVGESDGTLWREGRRVPTDAGTTTSRRRGSRRSALEEGSCGTDLVVSIGSEGRSRKGWEGEGEGEGEKVGKGGPKGLARVQATLGRRATSAAPLGSSGYGQIRPRGANLPARESCGVAEEERRHGEVLPGRVKSGELRGAAQERAFGDRAPFSHSRSSPRGERGPSAAAVGAWPRREGERRESGSARAKGCGTGVGGLPTARPSPFDLADSARTFRAAAPR